MGLIDKIKKDWDSLRTICNLVELEEGIGRETSAKAYQYLKPEFIQTNNLVFAAYFLRHPLRINKALLYFADIID